VAKKKMGRFGQDLPEILSLDVFLASGNRFDRFQGNSELLLPKNTEDNSNILRMDPILKSQPTRN
jgi:hypothetical protein